MSYIRIPQSWFELPAAEIKKQLEDRGATDPSAPAGESVVKAHQHILKFEDYIRSIVRDEITKSSEWEKK